MENIKKQELQFLITEQLIDITISNPMKEEQINKIKIRPMEVKGQIVYQIEEFTKTQAFHKNVTLEQLTELFPTYFEQRFRQAQLRSAKEEVQILVSKKGAISILRKKVEKQNFQPIPLSHNHTNTFYNRPLCIDPLIVLKE